MPEPLVRGKPRNRNKDGTWRKKRTTPDTDNIIEEFYNETIANLKDYLEKWEELEEGHPVGKITIALQELIIKLESKEIWK